MTKTQLCCDVMVLRTRAKKTVQVEFREVNASGVFLAQTGANQKNSMSLLQQNGFRPLTYQEAIVKIDQNPELKEQLKGKWFYLDDKGSQLSGYYTFNDKGELTQGKGDIEKTVYIYKGNQPLSFLVHTDDNAGYDEWRFFLYSGYDPSLVAPVVVGLRAGHEVATPKIEASENTNITPKLRNKFKTAIAKAERVLDPEVTDVFKEVLRAIK
jgi:hypothetical protein